MLLETCADETGGGGGGGGNRYKLQGLGGPEGGTGPECVVNVFVFLSSIINCRMYKRILSDQSQVTLQMRVSLSGLV